MDISARIYREQDAWVIVGDDGQPVWGFDDHDVINTLKSFGLSHKQATTFIRENKCKS